MTTHVASFLLVHFGTLLGLRSGIYLSARPQNRYLLLCYAIFVESSWYPLPTTSSQTHNIKPSGPTDQTCQYPYFSFEPDALMRISPGSVRTCSVSRRTPHNRRQVYAQYFRRLYPRIDRASLLRHLLGREVGPKHIRMKPHPYLVCDRVYSVTGQSRLIGLYLLCLICAKAVVSYYFAFGIHINGKFTVRGIP